jgi:hypothetical protein
MSMADVYREVYLYSMNEFTMTWDAIMSDAVVLLVLATLHPSLRSQHGALNTSQQQTE